MARAIECDHCGKLHKPVVGDVWIEGYHVRCAESGMSQGYSNENDGALEFCTDCTKLFLDFVKHDE